jgi:membrane protein required for colicin V production
MTIPFFLQPISLIDWVILALAVWFVLHGLRTGLLLELGVIIGAGAGFVVAGRFAAHVARLFPPDVNSSISVIAGYAICFLITLAVVLAVAHLLTGVAQLMFLGWLNNLGGAIFGLGLVVIICAAGVVFLNMIGHSELISRSHYLMFIQDNFGFLIALIPDIVQHIKNAPH